MIIKHTVALILKVDFYYKSSFVSAVGKVEGISRVLDERGKSSIERIDGKRNVKGREMYKLADTYLISIKDYFYSI